MENTTPQQLVQFIIDHILPENHNVAIDSQVQEDGYQQISITAPEDIKGRIIGKQGKIIRAIRLITALSFPGEKILVKVTD